MVKYVLFSPLFKKQKDTQKISWKYFCLLGTWRACEAVILTKAKPEKEAGNSHWCLVEFRIRKAHSKRFPNLWQLESITFVYFLFDFQLHTKHQKLACPKYIAQIGLTFLRKVICWRWYKTPYYIMLCCDVVWCDKIWYDILYYTWSYIIVK